MIRVIAALDGSPATRPVLAAAEEASRLLDARLDAIHVRTDTGERTAQAVAEGANLALAVVEGQPVDRLVHAANADDVAAMVVGSRRTPTTPDPGRTARQIAGSIEIPLFVVPPDAMRPHSLRRIMVPLYGSTPGAVAPRRRLLDVASPADLDVLAVHITDEDSIPAFTDQPQHETPAWTHEFLSRYSPVDPEHVTLQMRVGDPVEELMMAVGELDPDVVALPSGEAVPRVRRVLDALLVRSRVPVLLVPVVPSEPASVGAAGPASAIDD